jgi:hypothetical protein
VHSCHEAGVSICTFVPVKLVNNPPSVLEVFAGSSAPQVSVFVLLY